MKLSVEEKNKLIKALKDEYATNQKMLEQKNIWLMDDIRVEYLVERNKQIAENCEYLEKVEGELEIDTNSYMMGASQELAWLMVLSALFGGFGDKNNSND